VAVDAGAVTSTASPPEPPASESARRAWWRRELLLALELAGLCGLAIAAPMLEAFGNSPESLIAQDADRFDVLGFALVVALGPPLALAALGALTGLAGSRARRVAHLVLLGVIGGLAGWRLAADLTSWTVRVLVVTGVLVGATVVALRQRYLPARSFLRFAAVAPVVFLAQFLVASPSSVLVFGRDVGVEPEAAAATAALADDGPPIVMVVLDALPTAAMLDGTGSIDDGLYPNLAGLAAHSTWYRNHTTVAPFTLEAVPAMLNGDYPDGGGGPTAVDHPRNLFTLLGDSYDLSVHEQVTFLCPGSLCPRPDVFALNDLLDTAIGLWSDKLTRNEQWLASFIPRATDGKRYERYEAMFAEESFEPGERPGLFFYHLMLPHEPFQLMPDGSRYHASHPPRGLFAGHWGETGIAVARQRFVLQLQAADRLLGQLFDELRAAGTYDDALIVVTADHGNSFVPEEPWRGVSDANLAEVMWTPLIVKAPGQDVGRVDDGNVEAVDVLPTVADILDVEVPWDVDGRPADDARGRDGSRKRISDWEISELRSEDGDMITVDGRGPFEQVLTAEWVENAGPLAVWQRGEHDNLLGRPLTDLEIGEPVADVEIVVDELERWEDVDLSEWPPLELAGHGWVPRDAPVAIGLNGVVAAVVPTEPTPYGVVAVHALLLPEARREGHNELTAYAVADGPDGVVLHPMELVPRS
jgi:hypothetical protein